MGKEFHPPLVDSNRSVWVKARGRRALRKPLAGRHRTRVAIVGAGFTGLSTAFHLTESHPDTEVTILEAARIGSGASGRNGGMMLNWIGGLESEDLELAQASYRTSMEGIAVLGAMIERLAAPGLWRREGSLDVYTDARRAEASARECERLQSVGIPITFLPPRELAERLEIRGVHGAQLDPNAGQLDGLGLLLGLAPLLEERGVRIHEGSPVLSIREGAVLELELPGGTVEADAVVLATNAYTARLGYFTHSVLPLHSHVIGTHPREPEEWRRLGFKGAYGFADDSGRVAYAALSPRGELIFGGGGNEAYSYLYGGGTAFRGVRAGHATAVRRKLLHYMPQLEEVEFPFRWSGPVGLTLTRVCTMGVMGARKNVFYALGYSGHGVVMANLAGRVIRDLWAGDAARWSGLPLMGRDPLPIPPEPFRWIGYQAFTRLTGKSPRRRMK